MLYVSVLVFGTVDPEAIRIFFSTDKKSPLPDKIFT